MLFLEICTLFVILFRYGYTITTLNNCVIFVTKTIDLYDNFLNNRYGL